MKQKFIDYLLLMRLHRPIGIWLLLWPTLWALWLAAGGLPPLRVLAIFVLGTVVMRSAGCVINDYADRAFDPQVARTRDRPLAAGRVRPGEAIRLFVVLCLIGLGLVEQLNTTTVLMSLPAVLVAASYPYAKRFHPMPQLHLGVAFSWGIPMAFTALDQPVPWGLCAVLIAANLCWVVAYDTFYAMVDREDDLKAGVKSSAILFGRHDRAATAILQVAALALLALAGAMAQLGPAWWVGLAVATVLAGYQQWLVRDRDPARCFRAFLNNAWFGGAVFAGLAVTLY